MSAQQRRKSAPQKRQSAKVPDLWKPAPPLPPVEPIAPPAEVGSLLRSLGDPPTHNGASAARYCDLVTQRAAGVAMALALSVDLFVQGD